MSQDPHLISYLLLLRFGPVKNPSQLTLRLNYASIAKVVKMHPESCRRLIA